jgi:hypothetical protein
MNANRTAAEAIAEMTAVLLVFKQRQEAHAAKGFCADLWSTNIAEYEQMIARLESGLGLTDFQRGKKVTA